LKQRVRFSPVTTLDPYLAIPREVVAGTLMIFPGLKDPQQRADAIAWLVTLK
jgi:cytochrome c2